MAQNLLTTSEVSNLWDLYMTSSMFACVLGSFRDHAEDETTRSDAARSYQIAARNQQRATELFQREEIPVPHGFTEVDVRTDAPRLLSDVLVYAYLRRWSQFSVTMFSQFLGSSIRHDVRQVFHECLNDSLGLYQHLTDSMLEQGIDVRPPVLAYPREVRFVERQSFWGTLFGDQRPLLAAEIDALFHNMTNNRLGTTFMRAFSQTAQDPEIRDYFTRGQRIAAKHVEIFNTLLLRGDVPAPMSSDAEVNAVAEGPFSDKLMLFHTVLMNAAGIALYGLSLSASTRRDLTATYPRLMVEVGQYGEDGLSLLIERGWLEEPPHA